MKIDLCYLYRISSMNLFIVFFLLLPLSFFGMETPVDSTVDLEQLKNESLIEAIKQKKLSSVELLCKLGANVDFVNESGKTPLLAAIENDDEKTVAFLVKNQNANVSQRAWSTYPMDIALENNNATIIELLGNRNAKMRHSVNSHLDGALNKNNKAAISFLLMKQKADINRKASKGITPLHWAAKNGDQELITFLLANNANKEAVDENGKTPLFHAISHPEIAKIFIENGANVNHCTQAHQEHRTAIFYAVWKKDTNFVAYMIDKGATVNIIDSHNKTPLYYAIEAGDEPMVKLLVEKGADPNLLHTNRAGYTPLAIAAKNNFVNIIDLLLNHGTHKAIVDLQDSYGDTALLHARTAGSIEAFQALIAAGAKVENAKNIQGVFVKNLNPEIEKIINQTVFQRWSSWFFSTKHRINVAIFFANIKNTITHGWKYNPLNTWFKNKKST